MKVSRALKKRRQVQSGAPTGTVRFGGTTARQRAIDSARAWQVSVAEENTPRPSPIYLIVRDLLDEVLASRR